MSIIDIDPNDDPFFKALSDLRGHIAIAVPDQGMRLVLNEEVSNLAQYRNGPYLDRLIALPGVTEARISRDTLTDLSNQQYDRIRVQADANGASYGQALSWQVEYGVTGVQIAAAIEGIVDLMVKSITADKERVS